MRSTRPTHLIAEPDLENGVECTRVEEDVTHNSGSVILLTSPEVIARGGKVLPDLLDVVAAVSLLFSERSYFCIKTLELCPGIQWHSIKVRWLRQSHQYYVADVHISDEHDIWDYSQSKYSQLSDTDPAGGNNVGNMWRAVPDLSALPSFDLFMARFNYWIVSDVFQEVWTKSDFTGMRFAEMGSK